MQPRIEGIINAREVIVGRGAVVEPGAYIGGKHGAAERVILGDYCYVGHDVRILAPEFRLGHYSKLHAGSFGHGEQPLQIGRNCWIGGGVTLDSMGGLTLDDGVGVGAGSQLWTHIQFGDIVEGCRFYSRRHMHVGRDAWLVGHCIVSPVEIGERAMALAGSVVTRDMLPNHVYGGVPAVDLTAKLGEQFEPRTVDEKADALQQLIDDFEAAHPEHRDRLVVVTDPCLIDRGDDSTTFFDVSRRVYTRTYSEAEVAFLKANVPLVKFTAEYEPAFIDVQNVLQMAEAV